MVDDDEHEPREIDIQEHHLVIDEIDENDYIDIDEVEVVLELIEHDLDKHDDETDDVEVEQHDVMLQIVDDDDDDLDIVHILDEVELAE